MSDFLQRIAVNEFIDPFEVRLQRTPKGLQLDLSALPAIEPMLIGRPVREVPDLVKHLCGICPVPHHLAGVMALEQVMGIDEIPEAAQVTRLVLLLGSNLEQLGMMRKLPTFIALGKAIKATAGCSTHFPDVAVPGGVRKEVDWSALRAIDLPSKPPEPTAPPAFDGASTFLSPHPLGPQVCVEKLGFSQFLSPAEFMQASAVPMLNIGGEQVIYRVLGASIAKTLHTLERVISGNIEFAQAEPLQSGHGIGLVDGPRGLLAHEYFADAHGALISARILTPTVQNEAWLTQLLNKVDAAHDTESNGRDFEQAIRLVNPCLPIVQAPEGAMRIRIDGGEEDVPRHPGEDSAH